jgi:hypothetical protein
MSESQSTQPKQVNTEHLHETAGEGEGVRSEGPEEMSVFDGAGRESVVAIGEDETGRRKQGTGASSEEAARDMKDASEPIGEDFFPPPK